VEAAARTPGRTGSPCGPSGAGHFVKMIHNGIEYGVMAA
jgi:6-phosphogluconate dehydrogenase (decarboxylating)